MTSPSRSAKSRHGAYASLVATMAAIAALPAAAVIADTEADRAQRLEALRRQMQKPCASRGLHLPDAAVATALGNLERQGFAYAPRAQSLATRLAQTYATRAAWLPRARAILGLLAIAFSLAALASLGYQHWRARRLAHAVTAVAAGIYGLSEDYRAASLEADHLHAQAAPAAVAPAVAALARQADAVLSAERAALSGLADFAPANASAADVARAARILAATPRASSRLATLSRATGWFIAAAPTITAARQAFSRLPPADTAASVVVRTALAEGLAAADVNATRAALARATVLPPAAFWLESAAPPQGTDAKASASLQAGLAGLRLALANGDVEGFMSRLAAYRALVRFVMEPVTLRIVDRPDARSGVWRYPTAHPGIRYYYLIVDAIGPGGESVAYPLVSGETQRRSTPTTFAIGVPQSVYDRVRAEKQASGRIANPVLGTKPAGSLQVDYRLATTGEMITEW